MINEEVILSTLKRRRLRFPAELEILFDEDYYGRSIRIIRLALLVGLILYLISGIIDSLSAMDGWNSFTFIRFLVVTPVIICGLVMSYLRVFKKIIQPAISIVAMVAGLGFIAMYILDTEKTRTVYLYGSLVIVLIWIYTLLRLRFIYATFTCWTIILLYNAAAVTYQGTLLSATTTKLFINHNLFFVSVNVIGMFAAYLMEFYPRTDFLHRMLIEIKNSRIEAERDELSMNNAIMHNELQMARVIQNKLIPVAQPSPDIYSLYLPMAELGGDLYDYIRFRESKEIGIFLSDVSGHGVPAALVTSMIKSIINESQMLRYDPAALLNHLNSTLVDMTADLFITAFYCIYNPEKRTIFYSNAGHNPPFIIGDDGIRFLDHENGKGIPLAIADDNDPVFKKEPYTNVMATLTAGSKLLLYTDGLMEASTPTGNQKRFFSDIAFQVFSSMKHLPCRDFVMGVYGKLTEFRQGDSFSDDICIICVDVK